MKISPELYSEIITAISLVQTTIRWKPGKDIAHLTTRKKWQHLPIDATLEDYQTIIRTVIQDHEALVYLYHYGLHIYPTIVAIVNQQQWLVLFSSKGIMETAFVIESPEEYLSRPEFELLGKLQEIIQ